MKTAPFNLEKALAEKPCVTRGGRKVLEIYKFNKVNDTLCALIESDDGDIAPDNFIAAYKLDGTCFANDFSGRELDLFMIVEPQVYCIGIHPEEDIDLKGCPMITSALPKERFEKEFITWKFRKVIEFTLDNEDES